MCSARPRASESDARDCSAKCPSSLATCLDVPVVRVDRLSCARGRSHRENEVARRPGCAPAPALRNLSRPQRDTTRRRSGDPRRISRPSAIDWHKRPQVEHATGECRLTDDLHPSAGHDGTSATDDHHGPATTPDHEHGTATATATATPDHDHGPTPVRRVVHGHRGTCQRWLFDRCDRLRSLEPALYRCHGLRFREHLGKGDERDRRRHNLALLPDVRSTDLSNRRRRTLLHGCLALGPHPAVSPGAAALPQGVNRKQRLPPMGCTDQRADRPVDVRGLRNCPVPGSVEPGSWSQPAAVAMVKLELHCRHHAKRRVAALAVVTTSR